MTAVGKTEGKEGLAEERVDDDDDDGGQGGRKERGGRKRERATVTATAIVR